MHHSRENEREQSLSVRTLLRCGVVTCIGIIAALILFSQSTVAIAAQSACGNSVTVAYGDTLRQIAARCNTTVAAILQVNPQIRNANLIYPGQVISMPGDQGDGSEQTVTIAPSQGAAGALVQLQAAGFAANAAVEIGFGRVESEYDIIGQATTDTNGALNRQMHVPAFADVGDRYVFVITPQGSPADIISNVFTVTGDEQGPNPQVTISPRSGSPGANIQVAVSGFPAATRITYGLGEAQGQLLQAYSTRTNRSGSAQLTLQVPESVAPDTNLAVTAFVPRQNGASATSPPFTVTPRSDDGGNLFTRTNIYLVALEDAGRSGMEIGCGDSVVTVEVPIEPTVAPLTTALGALFDIDERFYGQSGLYNALYQSDLSVDSIDITDGVASLYLSGALRVGGVCDEPRVRAQLEETALQYSTVDEVRIFFNGEPLSF
ncbi:MAG: LysM peptidoglycan-binding domain-containing protein [Caldilineaceae bacterium]